MLGLGVALQSGCGYSLAGRGSFLPALHQADRHARCSPTARPSIPTSIDGSPSAVRTEFIGRGKWTIVPDATGVDALVTGTIVGDLAGAGRVQPAAAGDALRADADRARSSSRTCRPTRCSGRIRRCSTARSSTSRRQPGPRRDHLPRPGRQRARADGERVRPRARQRDSRGLLMPSATPTAVRAAVARRPWIPSI